MRLLFSLLIASVVLFSCGEDKSKEPVVQIKKIETEIGPEDDFYYDTLKGMYTGDFGGSEIRIILNYVSGSNAIGYNIHKGLQRNLQGKVSREGDKVSIILNEPGDHEFDGIFKLTFTGKMESPTGVWESLSGKISKKNFKLKKIVRKKDDDDYYTLNQVNFTNLFSYCYDTLGDYRFEQDGLCVYEYYPKKDDETRVEQMIRVKGSWSLSDSIVAIDWQPNKRFKNSRMIFIVRRGEYEEPYLDGEGMKIYNHWY